MKLSVDYDSLSAIAREKIQIMIEDYIMVLKKRVNPNSIPTFYYPIQSFCEANDIDLRWKKIRKLFPAKIKVSGDQAYTTEDVKNMLSVTPQFRNKAILHFLASTGCRVGALIDLKIRHISDVENCKSVLIYEDLTEEYLTFLTPEASVSLEQYFEKRRQDGEELSPGSPMFRAKYILGDQPVKHISYKGLTNVVVRAALKANLRDPEKKKNNIFSKQIDHAFRKRFNIILKLNNSINVNIAEKLMGHSVKIQLDNSYLPISDPRVTEEMFKEFKKAIPELTVDGTARKQAELEQKSQEVSNLQKEIDSRKSLQDQVEKMEKRQEEDKKEMKRLQDDENRRRDQALEYLMKKEKERERKQ